MIKKIVSIILIISMLIFTGICAFAHDSMLNVEYDDCVVAELSDGEDETCFCI